MRHSFVDCFIATNYKRDYFRSLTAQALFLSGFNVTMIHKPMLERYLECEKVALSPIYILCDDDIIPGTPDTLEKLIGLMYDYPELSQLGLSWKKDLKRDEISGWVRGDISEDIWEMDHVGGCMAIRKGTIKDSGERPEYPYGDGDDRIMGRAARSLGFKVGLANKLFFHHLGAGYTTLLDL